MLDSARRQAEETILDQRAFFLEPKAHEQFLTLLDTPVRLSREARDLLTRKVPWER